MLRRSVNLNTHSVSRTIPVFFFRLWELVVEIIVEMGGPPSFCSVLILILLLVVIRCESEVTEPIGKLLL